MTRNYRDLIEWIEIQRDRPAEVDAQARFARALARLDLPHLQACTSILIAGTNGKGTVAKVLESILLESGARTGLFTSPHLMKTTERIRAAGQDLTEGEFVQAFELIEPAVRDEELSHFQILTLMMAEVFFGGRIVPPMRYAVIEVGVGGRLDPTRLIPHRFAVVTRLGLDHIEILGDSLPAIAREKFAIVDEGGTLVHAPLSEDVRTAVAHELARASCVVEVSSPRFRVDSSQAEPRWILDARSVAIGLGSSAPAPEIPLRLKGARAIENASLALAMAYQLGLETDVMQRGLSRVQWPGRMEGFRLASGVRVYLSGDHNVQGVESLEEILRYFRFQALHLVVGIGARKPAREMLARLRALPKAKVLLTRAAFRATSVEALEDLRRDGESVQADPRLALQEVVARATAEDLVLVTGSLYLVGDIRRLLFAGEFGEFAPIG